MIASYLALYLVFIIAVSLLVAWLVYKLRLPSPRFTVSLILIVILSPLLLGFFYAMYFDSLPEVVVPDVTGVPLAAAQNKLQEIGLQFRESGTIYELRYPAGWVVAQRPEAGRTVKEGRIVVLMVCSGESKAAVPNLLGKPLSDVGEILAAMQFSQGDVRVERNNNLPVGTILAQEPLPGEEAAIGSRVDLLVSTIEANAPAPKKEEGAINLWLR